MVTTQFIKNLKLGYPDPDRRDFESEGLELRKDPEGYYVKGQLRNITNESIDFSRLDITFGKFTLSADYDDDIEIIGESVQKPFQWPPGVSLKFTTSDHLLFSADVESALKNIEYCFIEAVPPSLYPPGLINPTPTAA